MTKTKQTINVGSVSAIAVAALMIIIAIIFFAMFYLTSFVDESLQSVPEEHMADTGVVTSAMGVVFLLVIVCLLLSIAVAVQLYRRESEARTVETTSHLYQALSDSLDFSVNLYCPADGKVTQIVAKTVDIFGVTLESLIHNPDLARKLNMSPQGRAMLIEVRDGMIDSPVLRGTFSFRDIYSDSQRYVEYVVRPLRYMEKDQMLILLRDVTSDKIIEKSMKDAMNAADAANHAKSDFLLRMSHEIRTPMNIIMGKIAIARKNIGDEEKLEKSLVDIENSSDHLLRLINEVLDISKVESGKLDFLEAPYSLSALLESVNSMFAPQCAAKNLEYVCTTDNRADDNFVGDVMRLRQVLINLLSNAVKYTPRGGRVELHVEVSKSHADGYNSLSFTVRDNGIGMTKDYLERLYEPFAQEGRVKAEGTGLGMAIVKNIVSSMGGGIHVESKVNEGTTVTVVLNQRHFDGDARELEEAEPEFVDFAEETIFEEMTPEDVLFNEATPEPETPGSEKAPLAESASEDVASQEASPVEEVSEEEAEEEAVEEALEEAPAAPQGELPDPALFDFSDIHVLLAEDSDLNAEIVVELLSDEGMTVDWAEDGQLAYEKYLDSDSDYYDVVLMDIRMPNKDGYETTRAIRALARSDAAGIPIIALSANAFADDVLKSYKSGMNAHLSKPIAIREVLSTIAVELEKADNARLKRR